MMKLKYLLTIIVLFVATRLIGQQKSLELKVGDSLPIFTIPKIINSTKTIESTTNYKDKLLIIDFWGTGCKSCIMALPKMVALEKKIGPKLKILPVATYEKEEYLKEFLKTNKYTKDLNLSSVVEDKIFSKYFPHLYIPHEIWVYKGKVIGITDLEYVDEMNIWRVLKGEKVNWPVKYDFYSFDRKKPFFEIDEKQIDPISTSIQYAAISDYKEKINSIWLSGGAGIVRDSIKKTVRTFFLNQPIFNSYLIEFGNSVNPDTLIRPSFDLQANQVLWQVNDKSRYIFERKEGEYTPEWIRKNGICFESLYLDTGQSDREVHRSIISDMNRLLGLNVRWEKRKEKVMVITKGKTHNIDRNKTSFQGKKYHIYSLIANINEVENNPYVFDETRDEQTEVPLNNVSWKDLPAIRRTLQVYGFDMKEQEREVHKLIFTETDGGRLVNADMQTAAKARRINEDELKPITPSDNLTFLENNKKKVEIKVTSSGLQYKVLRKGKGEKPNLDDNVLINYEAKILNGKIFDSSYGLGLPVKVKVKDMIKGCTEALQIMNEGAKWELYIPAELAYDGHTLQGKIPPNSTLIFTLEFIKVLH